MPAEPSDDSLRQAGRACGDSVAHPLLSPRAAPSVRLRIVVVDDDAFAARLMRRLLEQDGHTVRTATCVREALQLAAAGPVDLLIADFQLPDGTGCDLLCWMRGPDGPAGPAAAEASAPAVRGIIVTGFADPDHARRSADAGFAAFLVKPITFDALERAIARLYADAAT